MSATLLNKIHHQDYQNRYHQLVQEDIRRLAKEHGKFVHYNCPACDKNEPQPAYELFGLEYQQCRGCRTIYLSPCPTDEMIFTFLRDSEATKFWRENMPAEVRQARRSTLYAGRADFIEGQVLEHEGRFNRLIDIGGGKGDMALELAQRGLFEQIVLVEPQPLDLKEKAIEVVTCSLQDYKPNQPADVAVAFEVLEHIPRPESFLEQVREVLGKDGLFLLSTPNGCGFETATLGPVTTTLWFDHVALYNPHSVEQLLERCGFEVITVTTPGELDVEIVHRKYTEGRFHFDNNPALKYLLEEGYEHRRQFQQFLKARGLSSHMKIVARKRG